MAKDSGTVATDGTHSDQFVTFEVDREIFGIPLSEVQEIIRVPDLVELPLCPPSLKGIANLRGSVLPISSLRRLFGMREAEHDDATRVVVVNLTSGRLGFVVDRMASVIRAEASEIEDAASMGSAVRNDLLSGVVKRDDCLILLLNPARLAGDPKDSKRKARRGPAGPAGTSYGSSATSMPQTGTTDEIQLVSFEADGQEYALPIADVHEIVQVPERVTRVPRSPGHVAGVVTLRERLLPLVSLRRMFALPDRSVDDQCRIVVVTPAGAAGPVGIVTDHVKEVLRINRSATDPVPGLLFGSRDGMPSALDSICRLDSGSRIVTILSVERMFADADLCAAIKAASAEPEGAESTTMIETGLPTDTNDAEEQVVVFRLAGEEYGVPIESVHEIVRVPEELTHVPRSAGFMEGVVNLRGAVLPVVDQRRRFELAEVPRNDRQRIMVLMIGGTRTGFIVDQVTEVLKIPANVIEPAPHLSAAQARLIRRIANLPAQDRIVLLIDPDSLLDAGERDSLARLAA